MHHPHRFPVTAALAGTLLTACGGGGGTAPPAPTAAATPASVMMSITIPPRDPNALTPRGAVHGRRPRFISPSTRHVNVYLNGGSTPAASTDIPASNGGGPTTIQISMTAPVGNDSFAVSLLDVNGAALAQGHTTQNIVAGPNTVTVTALGIPAMAEFSVSDANARPGLGKPASLPLNLMIADVDGNPISGTYAAAVTLSVVTQATSGYTLSATSIPDSTTAGSVTLNYDGRTSLPARVFVSTILNSRSAAVTIRPGAAAYGNAVLVALNTGAAGVVRVDASSLAQTQVAPFTANPVSLAVSPFGNVALIGLDNGSIAVYDAGSRSITTQFNSGGTSVSAITFSDDGTRAYALAATGTGVYEVLPITTSTTSSTTATGTRSFIGTTSTCGGIAADVSVPNVVLVSCTAAAYRVDTTGATTTATSAGSYGGPAITQALPPYLTYVGSPATGGNSTVTAFQLQNTGTAFAPVTTTTLAGPAVGVSLDPTERFLYVGGLGQMWTVTLDANGGFGSATATQTGGAGTVTTLGDYPGGAAGAPDARVWGAESDNLVFAVSTVGATTQTVRLTAIPVGIGFVP